MVKKRKKTTLWYTPEIWKILEERAEALHPGRGVTYMINIALQKEVHAKDARTPCAYEKVDKVQMCYAIPENLIESVDCLCKRWSITPATLIAKLAIEPHLAINK